MARDCRFHRVWRAVLVRGLGGVGIHPGTDPNDLDGDVVQAPAKICQVIEVTAGVSRMEITGERADLLVVNRPREAIGAEQVDVGELDGKRPLEVDLDVRLGPEAAGDDILGDGEVGLLGCQVVAPDQLPDQAVIERELIDPPSRTR